MKECGRKTATERSNGRYPGRVKELLTMVSVLWPASSQREKHDMPPVGGTLLMPQRFDREYCLACLLVHLCLDSAGSAPQLSRQSRQCLRKSVKSNIS